MMCLMGLLLTGCSDAQDDIEQVIGDEGCRVSIRVGASDNVETKAGDDPNALEHEFINELCVFVVDGEKIEQKFLASSTEANGTFSGKPSTGDAYEWRSDEFVLPAGKKTIYAFANWNTVNDVSWNAIIDKSVGDPLSDDDLKITIEDPAGKVDLANGKYIPMSVKQEVNVTVDQTIRVELVRLVGRVNIPADLAVWAHFEREVVLSPVGNFFELWDKDLYEQALGRGESSYAELAERLMGSAGKEGDGSSREI